LFVFIAIDGIVDYHHLKEGSVVMIIW